MPFADIDCTGLDLFSIYTGFESVLTLGGWLSGCVCACVSGHQEEQ